MDAESLANTIDKASNGKACILILDEGLSVYDMPIRNHPSNYEDFGDQFDPNLPYLDEKIIEEARLSLTSICAGGLSDYVKKNYESFLRETIIVKYTTLHPLRILYIPEGVTNTPVFSGPNNIENRPDLHLDGLLYDSGDGNGSLYITIFNKLLLKAEVQDDLSKEECIAYSKMKIDDQDIIGKYTINQESIFELSSDYRAGS